MKELIILCVIACLLTSVKTHIFSEEFEAKLHSIIKTTMKCRKNPGLTLTVVKENESWTHVYSSEDAEHVSKATRFPICSLTKSFTMTLLGILLDEKGMDWSTKISDIVGSGKTFIDEIRTKETTIRDLLSHRTGLVNPWTALYAGIPLNITRTEYSRRMQFLPELKPFRDGFAYNNYMYMFLGHIIEVLGDDTWESLMRSRLLEPLGMTSTTVDWNPEVFKSDGVAKPYAFLNGTYQIGTIELYSMHPFEAAGSILSNGEDMEKYMRFILRNGKNTLDEAIIDEKLFVEAFKVTTYDNDFTRDQTRPMFPVADTQMGYGYAMYIHSYRGYVRHWHSGGFIAYRSLMWVFPELNIGIQGSVNGGSSYILYNLFYYITDYLLGETPWLNETTFCTYPKPWKVKIPKSAPSFPEFEDSDIPNQSEYAGLYGNEYLPDISVAYEIRNSNTLNITMNKISGFLLPTTKKDTFLFKVSQPHEMVKMFSDSSELPIVFQRNGGKISSLQMNLDTTITFTQGKSIYDSIVVNGSGRHVLVDLNVLLLSIILVLKSF